MRTFFFTKGIIFLLFCCTVQNSYTQGYSTHLNEEIILVNKTHGYFAPLYSDTNLMYNYSIKHDTLFIEMKNTYDLNHNTRDGDADIFAMKVTSRKKQDFNIPSGTKEQVQYICFYNNEVFYLYKKMKKYNNHFILKKSTSHLNCFERYRLKKQAKQRVN